MKRSCIAAAAALALCALPATSATADDHGPRGGFTLAVYGDAPYGTFQGDQAEFDATPAFIDSVNADPDVSAVVHVGDIHSGKQWCTEAYDRSIAALWTHYADPLVYTPGDNEWTDCHKAGEGGGTYDPSTGQIDYVIDPSTGQPADYAGGNPVDNLALVRSIFFSSPGNTLGSGAGSYSCPSTSPADRTTTQTRGTEHRSPRRSRTRRRSVPPPMSAGWTPRSGSHLRTTQPASSSSRRPTCGTSTARRRPT